MEKPFSIVTPLTEKINNKFKLNQYTILFKINPIPEEANPVSWVYFVIEEIIKYFRAQYNPKSDDKIGLLIKNMVEKDIWIPMIKNVDLTPASIFERIFKIQQSNTELTFNRAVVIEITHVTI